MDSTLPETYDRDTLHMIARDPSTLYLYWELSAGKKRMAESHFERQWDELPKRIRLYDATRVQFNGTNARKIWEWPISRGAAFYFHHADPARRYVADLGVAGAGGQFLPMVRSNPVETPRALDRTLFGAEQHSLSRIGGDYSVLTMADGVQFCNYIDLGVESAVEPSNGLPIGFEQYSAYTLYPSTKVMQ